MNTQRHNKNQITGIRAILRVVAEFLAVIAVVFALTQPVIAQLSDEFGIVCGEDGAVIVQTNTNQDAAEGQHRECDDCLHCVFGLDRALDLTPNDKVLMSFPAVDAIVADGFNAPSSSLWIGQSRQRGPPLFSGSKEMNSSIASRFVGVLS